MNLVPFPASHNDHTPGLGPSSPASVNRRLAAKRPRRPIENDAYAAFARRILRAHGRRIAAGDVDALAEMADLSNELEAVLALAVTGLRERGYSWAEIGTRLEITRQAAQQRWGHLA